LPTDCDGTALSGWRLSGTFSHSSSVIEFGGDGVPFTLVTATASAGKFSTPRVGYSLSATGVLDGEIDARDIRGGGAVGAAFTYLPVYEKERRPFVALTGNGSVALVRAVADDDETRSWLAVDVRVGAMVGKSFFEGQLMLHAAVRGFGGPVSWRRGGEDVTGGDRYHVTAGAGVSLHASQRLSVSIEAMPLGEQSYAAGVTWNL
jgi:hypothetical protein